VEGFFVRWRRATASRRFSARSLAASSSDTAVTSSSALPMSHVFPAPKCLRRIVAGVGRIPLDSSVALIRLRGARDGIRLATALRRGVPPRGEMLVGSVAKAREGNALAELTAI
jgi:hypothetical protein